MKKEARRRSAAAQASVTNALLERFLIDAKQLSIVLDAFQ